VVAPKRRRTGTAQGDAWRRNHNQHAMDAGFALAEHWSTSRDLRGYVAVEKFDGFRALWLPAERCFRTRGSANSSDHRITPPASFAALLPTDTKLDGELWAGRGAFQDIVSLVRGGETTWQSLQYMVYDAPDAGGGFVDRLQHARARLAGAVSERVQMVETTPCEDDATKTRLLSEVLARGGEGLMLRRADSAFRAGRSEDLLKVKWTDDAEALVILKNGREDRSSVRVRGLNGPAKDLEFFITLGPAWRRAELPPGTVVTYWYSHGLQNGMPRHPQLRKKHPHNCMSCAACDGWRQRRPELLSR
jgi:DNA ligase-1